MGHGALGRGEPWAVLQAGCSAGSWHLVGSTPKLVLCRARASFCSELEAASGSSWTRLMIMGLIEKVAGEVARAGNSSLGL
jgi:hypothetical protein